MERVTESASVEANGSEKEEEERVAEEVELEGPSAVLQQLLQLLEGKNESWLEATKSLGRIEVEVHEKQITQIKAWVFDTTDNSKKSLKEWRMLLETKSKVRLLQAIGGCKTLREIDVEDLTGNELEALLRPMQSNPVLNSLAIRSYSSASDREPTDSAERVERICKILGRILQTSGTLKSLVLFLWRLTPTGAYHLASGLRGNGESALEILNLSGGELVGRSVLKHIAEMVLSAPRLSELSLGDVGVLDEDHIGEGWSLSSSWRSLPLADALAQSTSLKTLWLGNAREGISGLLLQGLTGEGSNSSITSLGLYGVMEGTGQSLPILLSSNQSLKNLEWDQRWERLSPGEWSRLGQSLSSNSSLELIKILLPWSSFCGQAIGGVDALLSTVDMKKTYVGLYVTCPDDASSPWARPKWRDGDTEELLSEVMKKPILELHFDLTDLEGLSDLTRMWADLAKALSSKVTPFSSLYLQMRQRLLGTKGRELENFFKALRNSSTLRLLSIEGGEGEYWPGGWKKLVDCLHVNTSITHLRLINCNDLDDEVFNQFMGVLQVNLTLKRVELNGSWWETDGRKALIEEALRRNAEQDAYFSVFRRHELPFHPARIGRLFLCGSPFAGKTRLRHTMTRAFSTSRWLGEKAAQLWRTEGIEVELLKNDEEMQIAIWDLAGQWIFRTLQDILFPRTNHTSIFLFMFSPYDRETCCMKEELAHCFKSELEEWLRFIASNSQVTGRILPKVLVVMSHMDKMKDPDPSWAKIILTKLGEEYKNILDIRSEKLFVVDARRKTEVNPLKHFIFQIFRELLKNKTLLAPKVCSQISSVLAKRTKYIKYRPVWSTKEFYSFCFNSFQEDVKGSLRLDATRGLEVFEAIASYLQDTGSVIIIRSLDRIIVDPNWLTHSFLGELISMGHNFEVEPSTLQKQERVKFYSRTGFVSSSDLQFLLSSFLENHPKFRELDKSFLEQLLSHFDLCYKIEDGPVTQYYIPTVVGGDTNFRGMEILSWSSPPESDQEFVGFRVQCDNPRRMSMTAALYPRFQIHIRDKLMTEMNLTEGDVVCSRNCMQLRIDGHEVFVERSFMTKSHIDVMVKCSKHKSREIAVKYIEEHIIDELRSFCASTKGCPGIILLVGILRTECVEKLVPLKYRGDEQAILVLKLKENFENYIKNWIGEIKLDSWSESNSSVLNYEHSWPSIPGYLPSSSELARKLLSEKEVENVTKRLQEKHEQQLKLLDQISEEMNNEIDQPNQSDLRTAADGSSSRVSEAGDPESSSLSTNIPGRSCTGERTVGRVLSKMDRLEHKIDGRFDNLEATLRRFEKRLNQVITLQHQLQSSMIAFMSKVDKVIGYAESWERSRTPKRPYLSCDDLSMFQKVTAAMRLGTAVRLHLMCESINGPHIVKDQPGLDLSIEKENVEWLRSIYRISSKMLYYLGKAALHVSLGLGEAVPELRSMEAALPLAVASAAVENIKIEDGTVPLDRNENMLVNEAWSRLQRSLEPYLKDNYATLFKLYRVKYLKEGRFGWVCDQCMTRGIRNRSLECL